MKKLWILIMALVMVLSLAACGGKDSAQVGKTEFTAEQQALAQDFISMAEEFDAIADRVNASPELLENEEIVTAMNDLFNEIVKADEYFASPETLTPEIMGGLTVAIAVGRSFIAEAGEALEESGY